MFFCEETFVYFNGALGVPGPGFLDVEVAHFPCYAAFGVDDLFHLGIVQEVQYAHLVETFHVALLINAFGIQIAQVGSRV
jgi:hypothetical protein